MDRISVTVNDKILIENLNKRKDENQRIFYLKFRLKIVREWISYF